VSPFVKLAQLLGPRPACVLTDGTSCGPLHLGHTCPQQAGLPGSVKCQHWCWQAPACMRGGRCGPRESACTCSCRRWPMWRTPQTRHMLIGGFNGTCKPQLHREGCSTLSRDCTSFPSLPCPYKTVKPAASSCSRVKL